MPAPAPTPPVVPKPPQPQPRPPAQTPPSDPRRFAHEGRWFGSANLVREANRGSCPPVFTVNGVVKDNIFNGSSSLGGRVTIRVRSETKRVADVSLPVGNVRSTSGTFEAFNVETTTGCIYTMRMFRQ
jgi:hypothetical protein